MPTPHALPTTYAAELRRLGETAAAFNRPDDAWWLQRASEAPSARVLLVVGPAGSGTAALLEHLAGRKLPAVRGPILQRYLPVPAGHERALVHHTDGRAEDAGLEHLDARSLPDTVRCVDWHVAAPDLPTHAVLVTAAADPAAAIETLGWRADAVLMTVPADALADAEAAAALLPQPMEVPHTPLFGVVTGSAAANPRVWSGRLARAQALGGFQQVFPFYLEPVAADRPDPSRRAVRLVRDLAFGAPVGFTRAEDAPLVRRGRLHVQRCFEGAVDRALNDRQAVATYAQEVRAELEERWPRYEQQAGAFVEAVRNAQAERAATEAAPPIPDARAFLRKLEASLHAEAEKLRRRLPLMPLAPGEPRPLLRPRPRTMGPPRAEKLPVPPVRLLDALAGVGSEAPVAIAQTLADDRGPVAEQAVQAPVEVALWQPAEAWLAAVAEQARTALIDWLGRVRAFIRRHLADHAAGVFAQRHGFHPADAAEVLERLELFYHRLCGRVRWVPAPHRPEKKMSPIRFLVHAQDAGFVEEWNRRLAAHATNRAEDALQARLQAEMERLRDGLLGAWDSGRRRLLVRLGRAERGRGRLRRWRPQQAWSARWALEQVRGSLRDPAAALRSPRHLEGPLDPLVLHGPNTFLRTGVARPVLQPLAEAQWQAAREALAAAWAHDEVVRARSWLPLKAALQVGATGVLAAGAAGAGLLLAWALPAGPLVGWTAALVPALLLGVVAGASGIRLYRFLRAAPLRDLRRRRDHVHAVVRAAIQRRMDEAIHMAMSARPGNLAAPEPAPLRMRYADLVQRLS